MQQLNFDIALYIRCDFQNIDYHRVVFLIKFRRLTYSKIYSIFFVSYH